MTVQITRLEHDAAALRQHAGRVSEAPVARRLLALASVLEGHSRAEAARSCGMDRQTLRDWVIRYNEHGIAGLSDLPKRGGAAPKLSIEEKSGVRDDLSGGRILNTLTFSHISVRPRHPQADAEAQEAHKKTSLISSPPSFPMPRKASQLNCGGRTRRASASKAA